MERSYGERYADFVESLQFEAIPDEVLGHAKHLVLDSLGIAIASTREDLGDVLPQVALAMGGVPESTVVGQSTMVPAPNAALANGYLAHFLDYDDSHLKSGTHNGATAVPTALAVTESLDATGRGLLTALVAGLEVMARVGSTRLNFHDKGFHATGIVGPFGAAMVAGKLAGLDAAHLTHALGICGSQAAALMECRYDGTMVKRMHPGWSGHAGILAARFAEAGLTGPRAVFEGHFGLYRSHLGEGTFDGAEVDSLGARWETLDCLIKPYCCSHYLHPYLDAAKAMRADPDFDPAEVDSIELLVSETGASLTCEAPSVQPPPATPYVAQFSLRYAVALMLVTGQARLQDFRGERLNDPQITALGRKMRHTVTEELTFAGKPYYSGWIKCRMKDGREFEQFEEFNRGSRQNPMPPEEVVGKFLDNATPSVGRVRAEAIRDLVEDLESVADIGELGRLLRFSTRTERVSEAQDQQGEEE